MTWISSKVQFQTFISMTANYEKSPSALPAWWSKTEPINSCPPPQIKPILDSIYISTPRVLCIIENIQVFTYNTICNSEIQSQNGE
jgi:hypothetical protein